MKDGEHQFVLGDFVIYTKSHLEARQVYDLLMESQCSDPAGSVATFTGKKIQWCRLSSHGAAQTASR